MQALWKPLHLRWLLGGAAIQEVIGFGDRSKMPNQRSQAVSNAELVQEDFAESPPMVTDALV